MSSVSSVVWQSPKGEASDGKARYDDDNDKFDITLVEFIALIYIQAPLF